MRSAIGPLLRYVCLGSIVCCLALPASADSLRVNLLPEDLGPFPPGIGGFVTFSVALELYDSEEDGVDTLGLYSVFSDIVTDTQLAIPPVSPALTGETGIYGPADVTDYLYEWSSLPEEQFIGGYGFDGLTYPFGGVPTADGRQFGQGLPMIWEADAEPNVPGLQPLALAGIGYGERPAGGDWLFADGQVPIPTEPGLYTVELMPYAGSYILPGIDLSVDHESGFQGVFDEHQLVGDSFSFTVLPEPASLMLLAAGLILLRRK